MSAERYPDLPGQTLRVLMTPRFSTGVQRSASMRETRISYAANPVYDITLEYEFLRAGAEAELQTLIGFFEAMRGGWDTFLFAAPDDDTATEQPLGTGDGSTTAFTPRRRRGMAEQLVTTARDLVDGPLMWSSDDTNPMWSTDDTTLMWPERVDYRSTDYTLTAGQIVFHVPPPTGMALFWTGGYDYRCCFSEDTQDFERFMHRLWTAKSVKLRGTLGSHLG